MSSQQREQNPDVNSYRPDIEPGEDPTIPNNPRDKSSDDVIPVPADAGPTTPIEEPPSRDDAPVGDVDDSPKRIA